MLVSKIVFYIVALTALKKSFFYIFNFLRSINFLNQTHTNFEKEKNNSDKFPFMVVCLPVLREQAVLKKTMNFFSKLKYPKDKLKIVLITTEKENAQKEERKGKLYNLTKDLSNQVEESVLLNKYLDLFTRDKIKAFKQKVSNKPEEEITKIVKQEYEQQPTTIYLAKKYTQELNQNSKKPIFYHLHYPKKEGVMAHQLNYASKNLDQIFEQIPEEENIFFGVYNADSSPNLNTLNYLALDYIKENKESKVYQQISGYVKNYYQYSSNFIGSVLKGSALIQTRWALGKEIPMLRKHWNFWNNKKNKKLTYLEKLFIEPAAYCVGHGLFVRLDTLKNTGGFPHETLNEDLPFGYYLSLRKIGIKPIPLLENVENPDSLKELINQKAAWYWGMIDYLDYWSLAKKKVGDKKVSWIRRTRLAFLGLLRDGLAWGTSSIFITYLLVYPLLKLNSLSLIVGWGSLFIYGPLTAFIISLHLEDIFQLSSTKSGHQSTVSNIISSLASIPYLIISSIGPWKTAKQKIITSLTNSKPTKRKTER